MSYSGPPPIPPGGSVPPNDPNDPSRAESPYGGPQAPGSPYLPDPSLPDPAKEYGSGAYGTPSAYGTAYGSPPQDASPYGTPPPAPVAPVSPAAGYGAPPPHAYAPVSPYATGGSSSSNSLGVTALVLSILGLCGGFFAVVGLVLGIQATKAVREGRANNNGVATTALVIGALGTCFWAIIWIVSIATN